MHCQTEIKTQFIQINQMYIYRIKDFRINVNPDKDALKSTSYKSSRIWQLSLLQKKETLDQIVPYQYSERWFSFESNMMIANTWQWKLSWNLFAVLSIWLS